MRTPGGWQHMLPGMVEQTFAVRAPKGGFSPRGTHFSDAAHASRQIPGQAVMTFDAPQRFRSREVDPRNPHFNDEPSAHVEGHGLIRDNTAVDRLAYNRHHSSHQLFNSEHAEVREIHPGHPIHTLQTERETARPSSRPRGAGPARPRMFRIHGKDVLVDGHHRLTDAHGRGVPIHVDYVDLDKKVGFGMTLADLHGLGDHSLAG